MLAMTWPISFDRPEWLWLMLAIPLIAAVSVRTLAGLERQFVFSVPQDLDAPVASTA